MKDFKGDKLCLIERLQHMTEVYHKNENSAFFHNEGITVDCILQAVTDYKKG